MNARHFGPTGLVAALLLAGCAPASTLPDSATYGPNPTLTAPAGGGLPTLNAAKAVGWPKGGRPVAAADLAVAPFAEGLDHPRWLLVLANGDVLVAETNSPARKKKSFEDVVAAIMMKRAGATVASPNRITLLRDADGDGRAETRTVLLSGLNSPFGMAVVGDSLYVANTDGVRKWAFTVGQTALSGPGEAVMSLPAGAPNNHWARNLLASPDGSKLYVTVGSNSNIADGGLAAEAGRAAIHELDLATGKSRIFASGLRNPNGLAWEPVSGALWTTVNERDMLGHDLVPDYMTSVRDGDFFGWPWSYYGQHVDARVKPTDAAKVASARAPDYALGAHTASLGLAFYTGTALPAAYAGGAFIGQHGSWNRKPLSGYRVVFVPFAAGKPSGPPKDVLTGFLDARGQAMGRPVGVAVDSRGALLVADDVGNVVWRVTGK